MPRVTVLDALGGKLWDDKVELATEEGGRFKFWSPYEPVGGEGDTPGHFNNQQGLVVGDGLIVIHEDERSESFEIADPPFSELGNKGRTLFVVKAAGEQIA